ncbi:MAG: hypothetical protein JW705_05780 [Methanosarcinaceae archaeon]|nr:hypothetical protein [Methanosarcinaceae archaeon]
MESRSRDHREIIAALVLVFFLPYLLPMAACDENELLLNGTGIFLTTGEIWTFDQGYQLKVKSVNPSDGRVWVELSLNGQILHEGILDEGETLAYSREKEILNVTLDTIYSSPAGELVTFKPVYQYLDPELAEPASDENTGYERTDNDTPDTEEGKNARYIPGFRAFMTLAAIIILAYCALIHKIKKIE